MRNRQPPQPADPLEQLLQDALRHARDLDPVERWLRELVRSGQRAQGRMRPEAAAKVVAGTES
jgi:hypothetical protein